MSAAEPPGRARLWRGPERARLRAGGLLLAAWLAACAGQVGELRADLTGRAIERRLEGHPEEAALRIFYAEHPQPLWVVGGKVRPEATVLLSWPGLDSAALKDLLRRADTGRRDDLIAAELALSTALIRAAAATRDSRAKITFAAADLAPDPVGVRTLRQAAAAGSLARHLHSVREGNRLFAELRGAAAGAALPPDLQQKVAANLERLRALPPDLGERFVLVDIAAARLWMYEDGRPVATMPVVVGAAHDQTPLMVARLSSAVLHPYWNIPPDIVSARIAPQVLAHGPGRLEALGMEALSGWSAGAQPLAAKDVDWKGVSRGEVVRVRQRPGPANTLGEVKFVMPNRKGIFLHDTPERDALAGRSAYRSAGCVRLQNAEQLGQWLFGEAWSAHAAPETKLILPRSVPIYLVYRSVRIEDGVVKPGPDPYGLDAASPPASA